jgi:hypothetical protein
VRELVVIFALDTTSRQNSPCVVALRDDLALPSSVFGPVDFCAFRRLAANFFSETMTTSRCEVMRCDSYHGLPARAYDPRRPSR